MLRTNGSPICLSPSASPVAALPDLTVNEQGRLTKIIPVPIIDKRVRKIINVDPTDVDGSIKEFDENVKKQVRDHLQYLKDCLSVL